MGLPKWLGGNQISDEDPLQVIDTSSSEVLGTPADTSASVTILGRLINLLSRTPAALGQAAAAASTPVVDATDVWTSPSNVAVSVANTTTALLAAAGATIRKRNTIIRNTGDRTVYLAWGEAATTAKFPLGVGESFVTKSLLAINGITASGTGTAHVTAEAAS